MSNSKKKKGSNENLIFWGLLTLILLILFFTFTFNTINKLKSISRAIDREDYKSAFEIDKDLTMTYDDYLVNIINDKKSLKDKLNIYYNLMDYSINKEYLDYATFEKKISDDKFRDKVNSSTIYKTGKKYNKYMDADFLYVYSYDNLGDKFKKEYLKFINEYVELNIEEKNYKAVSFGMLNLLNIIEPKYKNIELTYDYLDYMLDEIKNDEKYSYNIDDLNYIIEQYKKLGDYKDSKKKVTELSKAAKYFGDWGKDATKDEMTVSLQINYLNGSASYNNYDFKIDVKDDKVYLIDKTYKVNTYYLEYSIDGDYELLKMEEQSNTGLILRFKRYKDEKKDYTPYENTILAKLYVLSLDDEKDDDNDYGSYNYDSSSSGGYSYNKDDELYSRNDKNKDGKISDEEFQNALNDYLDQYESSTYGGYGGYSYNKDDDLYRKNDKNKDGKINDKEFQDALNDYLDGKGY